MRQTSFDGCRFLYGKMEESKMELVNVLEDEHLSMLNHSCAHMMAQAVKRLYPNAKFWVGPVISEGFYYDMDLGDVKLKEEDLAKIEKEMKKIAKDGKRIVREEISKEDALEMFKDDPYKIDLINGLEDGNITIYRQGEFADLCRGPHVETVKMCKNFKLLKHSGAYWKGDANNKMLQRVYGICFDTKEELEAHLEALEEAKKRDHKKLGKEMGLFTISEYAPGMPIFLPDGMILRNILEQYWYQEHAKEGYQFIKTPIMMSKELWELSGHWDHYKDNMYTSMVDDREFAIKPMNCPGALLVYNSTLHSYKDLPLRLGELGQVHRHEASGALNGLFRVRTFTQDDAHLFCRPDQVKEEFLRVMDIINIVFKSMNFENVEAQISLRDKVNREKYIGSDENWEKAEQAIIEACEEKGLTAKVEYGEAAFYGPKLDFMVKDAIGRRWQLGTIQVDYNLPERFQLEYMGSDNQKHRPVMIHRAPFGSMERFVAVLIEHTAGKFPLWLTPDQVAILPISEKFNEYAEQVKAELRKFDVRAIVDDRNEKIGRKIRDNEMKRIPYMLIVGEKEAENGEVAVRKQGEGDKGTMKIEEFGKNLAEEVSNMINKW